MTKIKHKEMETKNHSNIEDLPSDITEYAKLTHEKKMLSDKLQAINRNLRKLNQNIIDQMKSQDKDAYEICPTLDEENTYGKIGAVLLKMRNKYEHMSHDSLIKYGIAFFKYILPEEDDTEITRLGHGMGNWIWTNRERKPEFYLERMTLEKPKNPGKRKAEEGSRAEYTKRPKHMAKDNNVPSLREDFLAIEAFQNLINPKQE